MPDFKPFRAIRYSGREIADLVAPPYDVLSSSDVEHYAAKSAHNIVHIDVPQGGDDRYQRAALTLQDWLHRNVLVIDDEPSLTIYRMAFTDATGADRLISGVFGSVEVVDEGAGRVLPHEQTTPKAKTDRLDLTRATSANLSPVWGLSLAGGLTEALAAPGELVAEVCFDGVRHIVERVSDPARIAQICEIIGSDDVLIADGHHRYAISRSYRDEVRNSGIEASDADYTLIFINELVEDQLSIEAIHRLYDNVDFEDLKATLAKFFDITAAPSPTKKTLADMVTDGALVLLSPDGQAWWLKAKPGAFDQVRNLDGAWLEHALANLDHEVSYQHGLDEMLSEVVNHSAGVLIRPTSQAEITKTARQGLLMPPKSTFFTPKLLTGLVIRPTQPLAN